MAFMICFTNAPDELLGDDDTPWGIGRIVAGDLDEEFVSNLFEWDKHAYEAHWLSSLERLLKGDRKAVLIKSYVNPKEADNISWWALYRGANDVVHVQDHTPWYENFDRQFSVDDAASFLHDRETVTEDGDRISEWDVPLKEVELFVANLKQP